MRRLNNVGSLNVLLIPLILIGVLFVAAGSFGIWAFMSRQDYKYNTDQKVTAAVEVAKKQAETAKDNEFVEKEKLPLEDYQGPAAFGAILIRYPKTWSAYVGESADGPTPVSAYFHPKFVPKENSQQAYALRVEVVANSYAEELKKFDVDVKAGRTKATPFTPALVGHITGMRLDGEIASKKKGSMILLPMRDKTLKLSTEADQLFMKDFNENILPNFTFQP